jgi:hypothetical protein
MGNNIEAKRCHYTAHDARGADHGVEAGGTCTECGAGYQNLCDHVIIEYIGVV